MSDFRPTPEEIKRTEAALVEARNELEQVRSDLSSTRASHGYLCRGIKKVLGLENWPEMPGLFADGVIGLVQAAVDERDAAAADVQEAASLIAETNKWFEGKPSTPDEWDARAAVFLTKHPRRSREGLESENKE